MKLKNDSVMTVIQRHDYGDYDGLITVIGFLNHRNQ